MIERLINKIAGWLGIKRRIFIRPTDAGKEHIPVSFAITVCNEAKELETLLDFLAPYLHHSDEVVVQADQAHVTNEVKQVIQSHAAIITRYVEYELNYDFARAKNHLNQQCQGQWIFQLDADECPPAFLMNTLQAILHANPEVELIKIPRKNIFVNSEGQTEQEYVAWPDYQGRLYRNDPERIQWHRPIHEKIRGHKAYVYLSKEDSYALLHRKVTAQDRAKWQDWKKHYT